MRPMKIYSDSIGSPRATLAVERMQAGDVLIIADLAISVDLTSGLNVTIWSRWDPKQAPKDSQEAELRGGLVRYQELLDAWPELAAAVRGLNPGIDLAFDYGMGSITIGRLAADGSYSPS